MSRYIDAEKLKCSIDSETDSIFDWDMTIEELYYNLCKLIDDEPTADVQPVKRGTWENTNTPNQLRCSNCEIIHFIAQYPHGEINYCPNCGARMDSDSSIADIINEQPAADVQEVKRGYWQNKYRSGTTIKEGVVSSCCDMWNNRKSQFCPNCGARMDGDNNG